MNKPHSKPNRWDRVQQLMVNLVTLSAEAAKLASALRQIIR